MTGAVAAFPALRNHSGLLGVVALIAVVCALGAALTDRFLSIGNFVNVYEQSTDLALVSLGQTLAILTGGIDLSVGSLISLTSCLTSGLINGDPNRVIPVVLAVLALVSWLSVLGLENTRWRRVP